MKKTIMTHLNDPGKLEQLYRSNKSAFKQAFAALYPEIQDRPLAEFWHERLNHSSIDTRTKKEWWFLIILAIAAGLIAKFPALFQIEEDYFYARNIGFVVFPVLTVYFARMHQLAIKRMIPIVLASLSGALFINFFPDYPESDTLRLSSLHLLLFLWVLLGWTFIGGKTHLPEKWPEYLKYNGETAIMTALILVAGGIFSALTIGLFATIGTDIEAVYFDYVGIFGLCAAPIAATHLTRYNPQLVGRISPLIARIFSPLVAAMLAIFLIAMVYSGKNPYNDREFLLVFNALLIGVMAVIFFTVSGIEYSPFQKREIRVLLLLSFLTLIVNGVALSAILFRISEWGISPNRTAVLGANVLVLAHLLLVTTQLWRSRSETLNIASIGKAIGWFMPVYFIWSILVTFVFPFVFGFDR
ncbi:hypothetical protein SAMN04488057_105119 [Cyclobacterium lianum]|uniref:DUF4153 domain-containing protein n=1 Tax=Cyclobacterium lianum TaxID=388280 RepID=A0A1M7N957_9BACT|nr:hypothetical protein [Cyclobacterium lianum]SHM99665.1 hypothetical protein SAMN04488057_105119 [Cyclobacterium lianum]